MFMNECVRVSVVTRLHILSERSYQTQVLLAYVTLLESERNVISLFTPCFKGCNSNRSVNNAA